MEGNTFGIICGKKLADLDFADDFAFALSHTWSPAGHDEQTAHVQEKSWAAKKTKTKTVGKLQVMPTVTLDNWNIENIDKFQYLGSYVSEYGDVEADTWTRTGIA